MVKDIIIPIGGTHPPEPNNKCGICNRTIVPSRLIRCSKCRQLSCRSCIIEDLQGGEYLVCLNCARRCVSPKVLSFKGKYFPLTLYLSNRAKWKKLIRIPFSQLEGIIAGDLPASAYKKLEWWKSKNSPQVKSWLSIGWRLREVNLKEKIVIFTRPEVTGVENDNKTKKTSPVVSLPEYKAIKRKRPSMTRMAIAQARLQNISSRKSALRKYRGKFRPKSAFEKKLWKPDEKPENE